MQSLPGRASFGGIHIRLNRFASNMRQKLITLDPTSWDLAAKKTNFSEWVRNKLRSERNGGDRMEYLVQLEAENKELERLKEYWYETARDALDSLRAHSLTIADINDVE